jgi:hypothetical protein
VNQHLKLGFGPRKVTRSPFLKPSECPGHEYKLKGTRLNQQMKNILTYRCIYCNLVKEIPDAKPYAWKGGKR